ncbi:MAG: response regulator transcription factor [Opitutales bacterium]
MRILVLEDEPLLARHIVTALNRHGHQAQTESDGAEGLQIALAEHPDLVVLDLGLPGLDGLTVLARLRAAGSSARVLILTAWGELEHRVAGLKAGADDYLTKPFAMDELLARVEAVGRRAAAPTAADHLQAGDLQMDVRERKITRGGAALSLSPREFDLLRVLLQEPGRVFSRRELCELVWQRDHEYDTRTVEIFIARLRKKVDTIGTVPLIHTVRSVGYTLRTAEA